MLQYISYCWTSRKRMIQLAGEYCTLFLLSLEYPLKLARLIKYVEMKRVVKSIQLNICLIDFLFKMV
jgi:hypothetical protein